METGIEGLSRMVLEFDAYRKGKALHVSIQKGDSEEAFTYKVLLVDYSEDNSGLYESGKILRDESGMIDAPDVDLAFDELNKICLDDIFEQYNQ